MTPYTVTLLGIFGLAMIQIASVRWLMNYIRFVLLLAKETPDHRDRYMTEIKIVLFMSILNVLFLVCLVTSLSGVRFE